MEETQETRVQLLGQEVSLEKKTINVNHQLLNRKKDGEMRFYCTSTTKTRSGTREIPMSAHVVELFKRQRREWFKIEKDTSCVIDGYSNFVFLSHVTGRPLYPNNVRKQMRRIVDMNAEREIQLPPLSPHILRHTLCTRYAEAGMDIRTIQYLIGHTDYKTTMMVYNHVDMERAIRAVNNYENWSAQGIVSEKVDVGGKTGTGPFVEGAV